MAVSLVPASSAVGGGASTAVSHDITYATSNGSGVLSYQNLSISPSILANGAYTVTNNAPSVATINASTGVVTPVSAGIADISVNSGPSGARVQFPVVQAVNSTLTGCAGLAAGSVATPNLLYHIWSQINAACALSGGTGPSVQEYYSDGAGTVNGNLFIKRSLGAWSPPAGFAPPSGTTVTYIPLSDAQLAPLITGGNLIPITPRHALIAAHCCGVYASTIDAVDAAYNATGVPQSAVARGTATFNATGGSTGTAAYTAVAVSGSFDLAVVYNESAAFSSVATLMPSNWATFLPQMSVGASVAGFTQDATQYAPLPVWIARHHRSLNNDYANGGISLLSSNAVLTYLAPCASIQPFDCVDVGTDGGIAYNHQPPTGRYASDATRAPLCAGQIYPGDSGSSVFVPVNGVAVLTAVVSTINTDDFVGNLITQINAAIAACTALRNTVSGVVVDNNTYTVTTPNWSGVWGTP